MTQILEDRPASQAGRFSCRKGGHLTVSAIRSKDNPCKNCLSRQSACHDRCDRRNDWLKKCAREKASRRQAKMADAFFAESIFRIHPERKHMI